MGDSSLFSRVRLEALEIHLGLDREEQERQV